MKNVSFGFSKGFTMADTGEDADEMKTMQREYEEIGMNIHGANVMLSYVQGEDGMDSLKIDFFSGTFL